MRGETGQTLVGCEACLKFYEILSGRPTERQVLWYEPKSQGKAPEYIPFWCFKTLVDIKKRETAKGSGVTNFFKSFFGKEQAKSTGDHLFLFVPAWDLPVQQLRQLCPLLTRAWNGGSPRQGTSDRVPPLALPVTRTLQEAQQAVHFVFLTLEADLEDTLVRIDYDLSIEESYLALLPAKLGSALELLI